MKLFPQYLIFFGINRVFASIKLNVGDMAVKGVRVNHFKVHETLNQTTILRIALKPFDYTTCYVPALMLYKFYYLFYRFIRVFSNPK
ncbi:hypothetical protein SAMN06296241_0459 [Salinimicrobium sediminis]|uniref:Uncharacterized protein n=1 Tax=Salinimicrobium sediminis TaxID=1343891 RepID=A0A285X3I3_9FLAO|nr:hypothetical protein SAMN06296241_0459 [Salinimicrobium sediminis]